MNFLAAIKFLTIIPLPYRRGDSPEEIGHSVVWFPVVGLAIGLVLAGLNRALGYILPAGMVNAVLLAALVALTGALHLDGFIDTCDGIGGHKPAEERWAVMRDSRVGAFGVVGVLILLLVKFAALNSVPPALMTATLVIMPTAGRWMVVFAIYAFPYARPQGLGGEIRKHVNLWRFLLATAITLAIAAAAGRLWGLDSFFLAGLALMGGVWVIISLTAVYFKKMFAGLTGDNYGAIIEIAEVCALLIMVLLGSNGWLV